jgi:hypothetical protein
MNALAVGDTSRLAETRSFSMQADSHLFVVRVVLLDPLAAWRSGCLSLILCRLVGCDTMQLGAAMLCCDWLDGRSLEDWHLEVPTDPYIVFRTLLPNTLNLCSSFKVRNKISHRYKTMILYILIYIDFSRTQKAKDPEHNSRKFLSNLIVILLLSYLSISTLLQYEF